jgi:hypothetical protein
LAKRAWSELRYSYADDGGKAVQVVSFEAVSKEGPRRCQRHSSVDYHCPESNSRKTWALNAGMMLRRERHGISYSFRGP